MTHDLKIWPAYFGPVENGTKTFEIRKNDRPFTAGDSLILREWDPATGKYTGREVSRQITYVWKSHERVGPEWALTHGWCVLGLAPASPRSGAPS